jgi:predicted house-cleaning noncanonical NTP pyrophosphatase (MazG superfamily)
MLRKEYNKLIRDRIPEILEDQDVQFAVEEMSQAEYCQALRQKLIEEAREAAAASEHELINELADIWEVIDAIMNAYKISRNQVLACQMQKQIERGMFNRKLRLLWTQVQQP